MERGQIIANGPPAEVIDRYKGAGAKTVATAFPGIKAEREWPDRSTAPGDGIVRLRKVRVRTNEGETTAAIDIRKPVGLEMTFEVLEAGHVLVPNYNLFNQERLHLFNVQEIKSRWKGQPRPVGTFVTTAWVPGNFFTEGSIVVEANISSFIPIATLHIHQRDAVAFSVIDSFEGDASRGDSTGPIGGVIRPLLEWTTEFQDPQMSSLILEEAKIL
jgi:lipopolysaccharide transport system ATP-binding protein